MLCDCVSVEKFVCVCVCVCVCVVAVDPTVIYAAWQVGRLNVRRLLLVKLEYIGPFCAVTADVRVTDSTRAPSVLFAFRNEINPIGVGNISR